MARLSCWQVLSGDSAGNGFAVLAPHAVALKVVRVQSESKGMAFVAGDKSDDKILTRSENTCRRQTTPRLRFRTLGMIAQDNRTEWTTETHLPAAFYSVNGAETPAVGHHVQPVRLRPANGLVDSPPKLSQFFCAAWPFRAGGPG